MFNRIKDLIENDSPFDQSLLTDKSLRISVIALLVDAGLANSDFDHNELTKTIEYSKEEFGLTDYESGELLSIVKVLRDNRAKSDALISNLKDVLSVDQRINLLSTVWKILLADGRIDQTESSFAADARRKLDLTLEQAVLAQQIASDRDILVN